MRWKWTRCRCPRWCDVCGQWIGSGKRVQIRLVGGLALRFLGVYGIRCAGCAEAEEGAGRRLRRGPTFRFLARTKNNAAGAPGAVRPE